jgi:hypothetical protein
MDKVDCRADYTEVTDVKSDAYARPPGGKKSDRFLVTPETVQERCDDVPEIFEIAWEAYHGAYGQQTLMKETETSTATCPECGEIGRYDESGNVCCVDDECGVVISGDTSPVCRETYTDHGWVTTEPVQ